VFPSRSEAVDSEPFLLAAAARYGLTAAHPWSCDVGVDGHCLDAGTGPSARLLGLAAGAVIGADVVTPDGAMQHVAGDEDLLWSMRGGGGAGVVTSLDLRLPVQTRASAWASMDWSPLKNR
jgi:FAD/FMN-containing dehydrogenase